MRKRRTKTDLDREVTMSGATKGLAYIFGAMITIGIVVQTWPYSGIVLVLGLVGALLYFRNKRG